MQPQDANPRRNRLPGPFEQTIFSPKVVRLAPSRFIKAMHPKSEILATRESIERVLSSGWIGQTKIHGHRAQIHIPADYDEKLIVYNRQGRPHALALSAPIISELRRLFQPARGWNVLDGEWLKPMGKIFIFDWLKREDQELSALNYVERHALLPRLFISPSLSVLPLIDDVEKCLETLNAPGDEIEGLVFKSRRTPGFSDSSIIRCRKPGRRH